VAHVKQHALAIRPAGSARNLKFFEVLGIGNACPRRHDVFVFVFSAAASRPCVIRAVAHQGLGLNADTKRVPARVRGGGIAPELSHRRPLRGLCLVLGYVFHFPSHASCTALARQLLANGQNVRTLAPKLLQLPTSPASSGGEFRGL
jgi:hypothetical protein